MCVEGANERQKDLLYEALHVRRVFHGIRHLNCSLGKRRRFFQIIDACTG